jgi:hypothetical protein
MEAMMERVKKTFMNLNELHVYGIQVPMERGKSPRRKRTEQVA